jgi:hypothetical protein
MNDTMRTLTIFATILLPLTLVATIYGMNGLDLNSLSKLPSGFIIVIVTMIIITGSLFFLFSKKKWIIFRRVKRYLKSYLKIIQRHRVETIVKDNSVFLNLLENIKGMDGVRDVVLSEIVSIVGRKIPIPSSIIDRI